MTQKPLQRSFYTQQTFTHRSFYTQKLLHREAFTRTSLYTAKHLHTASFYTQKLLHREAFTQRSSYTQHKLSHRESPTQRSFCTAFTHSKPLHSFETQQAFTQRSSYTEKFVHRKAFTHRKLLHTEASTQRSLYIAFTQTRTQRYTETQQVFTQLFHTASLTMSSCKTHSITHAAVAPSNLDAAITVRSAKTELQNTIELRARTSAKRRPFPSIFRDTFCPAKHSTSCIRYLSKNEAFVRDFPEKVQVRDVKTTLSCKTSLKF